MNYKRINELTLRDKLSEWYKSPLGEVVYAREIQELEHILPELFGYHILQIGNCVDLSYLDSSKVVNKTVLFLEDTEIRENLRMAIRAPAEELPIAIESVDIVLLPHILEFSKDVHKLLRETERILICEGHVIVIGFNPLSFFGLWHLFFRWWNKMPWSGHFISVARAKDWLSLLDFEIKKVKYFFFPPPFSNIKLLKKFLSLEYMGKICYPIFGGLYIIVAKKRVTPLSPIKVKWQKKRSILATEAIKPTSREVTLK